MSMMIEAMERGWVPDGLVRLGIRRLCRQRLEDLKQPTDELEKQQQINYIRTLKRSPISVNSQRDELPAEFFSLVLGRNRKYSSAFWATETASLDRAEENALETTIQRAGLKNGMQILELGCGWGSLTLAMAKKFPNSKIVALSNSHAQQVWLEAQAIKMKLFNVTVLTHDISDAANLAQQFGKFDRIVSVEMFEHVRNYEKLFERVASWLNDEGKLFVHVFSHRRYAYLFETEGKENWLGKHFCTGSQMPSDQLFSHFQDDLTIENQWWWSGKHYSKTTEAWLQNMDENRDEIRKMFEQVYREDAGRWFNRWRVFFMSCSELFSYDGGSEWGVSHYLFSKNKKSFL